MQGFSEFYFPRDRPAGPTAFSSYREVPWLIQLTSCLLFISASTVATWSIIKQGAITTQINTFLLQDSCSFSKKRGKACVKQKEAQGRSEVKC